MTGSTEKCHPDSATGADAGANAEALASLASTVTTATSVTDGATAEQQVDSRPEEHPAGTPSSCGASQQADFSDGAGWWQGGAPAMSSQRQTGTAKADWARRHMAPASSSSVPDPE
jgi:hypothetical protein